MEHVAELINNLGEIKNPREMKTFDCHVVV